MNQSNDPDFDSLMESVNAEISGGNVLQFRARRKNKKTNAPRVETDNSSNNNDPSPADELIAFLEPLITMYGHDGDLKPGVTPHVRVKTTNKPDAPEALLEVGNEEFTILAEVIWAENMPNRGISEEAVKTAVRWARSKCFGPQSQSIQAEFRVSGNRESGIYIDLGDDLWRCIRIKDARIEILSHSDAGVYFRRGPIMTAFPVPQINDDGTHAIGNISELRPFLGLPVGPEFDGYFSLVCACIMKTFFRDGADPHLHLQGPKGSGKSEGMRTFIAVTDPSQNAGNQPTTRDMRDILTTAKNSRVFAIDNISTITKQISDTLCGLATGISQGTRKLRTDSDLHHFQAKCLVVSTSIADFVKPYDDLRDRTIKIPFIRLDKHDTKESLKEKFAEKYASIFGGVLNALLAAMRNYDAVYEREIEKRDGDSDRRLADFLVLGMAAESEFGVQDGTFIHAYEEMREDERDDDDVISASELVERAILGFAQAERLTSENWQGKKKLLYAELGRHVSFPRPQNWPNGVAQLGRHLASTSLRHSLYNEGVRIDNVRLIDKNRTRVIRIAWEPKPATPSIDHSEAAKTKPTKAPDTPATPATSPSNQGFYVAGRSYAPATVPATGATPDEADA